MSDWTDVALQSEFTAGSWRSVDVDGAQVAVFQTWMAPTTRLKTSAPTTAAS